MQSYSSEGPLQAGKVGWQKLREVQQKEMRNPIPEKEQPHTTVQPEKAAQYKMTSVSWWSTSSMRQQYALVVMYSLGLPSTWKTWTYWSGSSREAPKRTRECSTWSAKRGWKNWLYSILKKRRLRDLAAAFKYILIKGTVEYGASLKGTETGWETLKKIKNCLK